MVQKTFMFMRLDAQCDSFLRVCYICRPFLLKNEDYSIKKTRFCESCDFRLHRSLVML